MVQKPKVFIGSSSEHSNVAASVQECLGDISKRQIRAKVWTQGVFSPGSTVLESLFRESGESDFGIFVFGPDDVSDIRGVNYRTVRDNILFEFGLFIGRLGKNRTFMLVPFQQGEELKLRVATDLMELTYVGYDAEEFAENELQALGPACNKLWREIKQRYNPSERATTPSRATLPVIAVETPTAPAADEDDTCKQDKRVRKERTTLTDATAKDNSNLYYLLFSDVADCEGTRKVVRKIAEKLRTEAGPVNSFRLAGMYDTMGRWDIVMRFRLNQEAGVNPIMSRINKELDALNLRRSKAEVGLSNLINVQLETDLEHGVRELPEEIKHFRMQSTARYEEARCQRLFLYIGLPDVAAEAEKFVIILLSGLRNNKDVAPVVESVSISDKEIILEIFVTCSQTHIISILNREVEKLLPKFGVVRKYTLTCFYYDERELVGEE